MNSNSKIFGVNFEQEYHCDECMDVVHFHIEECPVCCTKDAPTDQYCSIQSCIDYDDGIFSCDDCDSKFQILSFDWDNEPEAQVLLLK